MSKIKILNRLIEELNKLPGIGPKSAQKLAFYILQQDSEEIDKFISTIKEAKEKITYCRICFNITDVTPCYICQDETRDKNILCVIEDAKDIIVIENTRVYNGLYHVLQGLISPLDGIGPENLRIKELLLRCNNDTIKEIILAISPTVEGEATSIYLSKLLKPLNIKITKLAYGLPVGSNIDYTDEMTLTHAFEGRREFND